MGVERLAVAAPSFLVRFEVGDLPSSLADPEVWRGRVGKAFPEFLLGEPMLRVSLPIDVEGELDEGPEALLALAQLLLRLLAR
jgi:hypothetical protein